MMPVLQSDETRVPVFGSRVDGAIYQDRPAAYAVVKDADGRTLNEELTALTIRDYQRTDFDKLYEIDHAVFSEEIAYSHLELRWYLRSRRCRTLVAEDEGEIIGFVTASAEPRKAGHIISIDVVPHRQRQHIGSRLLAEIESWLWMKGAEAIYLETAIDDTGARGFYERHGYVILEQLEGYYSDTLDAFLMMKTAKRSIAE